MTFAAHPVMYCVWLGMISAKVCLASVLLWRGGYRQYPAFTAFILYAVFRSAVLLWFSHYAHQRYNLAAWLGDIPQLVILPAMALEVFHVLFHPYDTLPPRTIRNFGLAVAMVALLVVGFTVVHPGAQPTAWMTFARAADQAVAWILCGAYALMALLAGYFGIPWRHRVFGIVAGFLGYLCADACVTTVIAQFHFPPLSPITILDPAAFLTACIIWSYYFWRPETPQPIPTMEELMRFQAALGRFSASVPALREPVKGAR